MMCSVSYVTVVTFIQSLFLLFQSPDNFYKIFLDQSASSSFLVQVNADIVQEATELPTKQCCLLATDTIKEVREVFLCLENQVLMRVEKKRNAVAALFAAFFFQH